MRCQFVGDSKSKRPVPSGTVLHKIFSRVLATLPVLQREALDFAFYRGLSQREIAAHTGIPLGTIKTRLELALRKVRTAIVALGGASEWTGATA